MSTTELNPAHVPLDDLPPFDTQPFEPEKVSIALTPPTSLSPLAAEAFSVQDGGAQTYIVDLTALGSQALGEPQKDDSKSSPVGEHEMDANHTPPSPHEPPEKDHSDAAPARATPTSDSTDSASISTPLEPPGLLPPVNDDPVRADEVILSAVEDEDAGADSTEPSCFSFSGLESLRTFIPDDLFPDDLLVYDPNNITNTYNRKSQASSNIPVRYVRIFPKTSRDGGASQAACEGSSPAGDRPVRAAHLYLKDDNMLGGGHHSSVYSAPLRLRLNADSEKESTVRVAVKTADARCGAHQMLHREALAYNAFPRDLMEDRDIAGSTQTVSSEVAETSDASGARLAGGETEDATSPTSTSGEASTERDAGEQRPHTPTLEPAVVPKFFGYYAAVDADGKAIEHSHRSSCDIDDRCSVAWPTRLLLVEECGKPIVLRDRPLKQRACCLKLFKRLHAAGFTQGSVYVRNILVQPGPLSALPEERSDGTPSFRIIDFGRVQMRTELSSSRFSNVRKEEDDWATDVLVFDQ